MTGTLTLNSTAVSGLIAQGLPPFSASVFLPFVGQPVSGTGIPDGTTVATANSSAFVGMAISGTPTITGISSTSLLSPGQTVSGFGIPTGSIIVSVDSLAQVTISANATSTSDSTFLALGIVLSQPATVAGAQTLTFGVEPITLAEAKAHAVVEFDDDDALIGVYITAARRYVETRLRSSLITQTWVLYLDGFPSGNASYYNRAVRQIWASAGPVAGSSAFGAGVIPSAAGVIDIPVPPLQQIISLNYRDFAGDLQTIAPSVFNVSQGTPARIQPVYSAFWPITPPTIDSVQVTFQAGYGPLGSNIPESAKLAIKFMVATWYQSRESISPGAMLKVPDTVDAILSVDDPGIYA